MGRPVGNALKNGISNNNIPNSDENVNNNSQEDKLKFSVATELDNLLSVSEFIEHQNDDGRHPQATGGWDVYSTRFEVGGTMFSGEVKIMVTDRGYLFYDITKIKRLPVNGGLTENNSVAASGNPSIDSINHNGTPVNSNFMQESENYSSEKNDLKFSVPTATENETDTDTQSTDFTAEFKTLMQSFQNGEISQDEYMRRVSELYQESIDENGQIKQGENVAPQNKSVAVPKSVSEGTKVREFILFVIQKMNMWALNTRLG